MKKIAKKKNILKPSIQKEASLSKESDISRKIAGLDSWDYDGRAIMRRFGFENFLKGLDFVNIVAREAEKMGHHPDIFLTYSQVTVILSTHDKRSVTEKDIELAKRIDNMVNR